MRGLTDDSGEHYFAPEPRSPPRFGLIRAYLRGRTFEFATASGVFSKKRIDLGTSLLIDSMLIPAKGCLLDIGCGYGAVGIVAAALNRDLKVFMVDVNARAVRLARENAARNAVSNVIVKRGFLYEPVAGLRFDAIVSNPPISAGLKVVSQIVVHAPLHLQPGGVLQVVVRSKIAGKRLEGMMKAAFGDVEVLARKSGFRVLVSKQH